MSASFKVESSTGSYDVYVSEGIFAESLSRMDDAHILADEFFCPNFAGFTDPPVFIEATEQAKSLDRIPAIIEQLRANGANRGTHLVAIGGGIVQDIAAFISSVYMRGISWSYYPTTVLAMVDSCIGGKSSINVGPYKNLVGTFHPPDPILIDPSLAGTLPPDQFASGLIEAAKICFCRGPESFAKYLACDPSVHMSMQGLESIIVNSLFAKKHFIEIDEFDKKERLLLNFGHTFGHAIESASYYSIPHGTAVGLGILCSLAFQRDRGVDFRGVENISELTQHLDALIRAMAELPKHLRELDITDVLTAFGSDKKHTTERYTLILVNRAGDVILDQLDRSPATDHAIRSAIENTIGTYAQ